MLLWARCGARRLKRALHAPFSPATFPLQNTFQRAPAVVRAETLQGRAPGFQEPFVAAGPVAARAEKILLRLPSHPAPRPRKEPCDACAASGTARCALPFPGWSHGISAELSSAATSASRGDRPRCSIVARDDPVDRPKAG